MCALAPPPAENPPQSPPSHDRLPAHTAPPPNRPWRYLITAGAAAGAGAGAAGASCAAASPGTASRAHADIARTRTRAIGELGIGISLWSPHQAAAVPAGSQRFPTALPRFPTPRTRGHLVARYTSTAIAAISTETSAMTSALPRAGSRT